MSEKANIYPEGQWDIYGQINRHEKEATVFASDCGNDGIVTTKRQQNAMHVQKEACSLNLFRKKPVL